MATGRTEIEPKNGPFGSQKQAIFEISQVTAINRLPRFWLYNRKGKIFHSWLYNRGSHQTPCSSASVDRLISTGTSPRSPHAAAWIARVSSFVSSFNSSNPSGGR